MFHGNKYNNFLWNADDWSPNGKASMLHKMNYVRFNYIRSCVDKFCSKNYIKNAMIADIGCGGGLLAESLARYSKFVFGIDASSMCIDVAKNRAKKKGLFINYQVDKVADFARNRSGLFDIVTVMEAIEHVEDQMSFVKDCSSLLKTDGIIFFSTISKSLKSMLLTVVFAEYIAKMVPIGMHSWDLFLKPQELRNMLNAHGANIVSSTGLQFNPLSCRWNLSSKMDVNYILTAMKN
ncbi:Ubiquinone biosynthesis O-methyltransferase [Candidatus Xenohaliotis californiensis]|uniref:Ubiquinone biosynthesis O-methyltransferase n=1 Tax=Candidatus Xenohaliotis californiensis TaxID=84677 RepID=A0ABM9N8N8_9RICK|nr:Ubiquinone biosynthesis O-methyltransferase [Candidatus Xenohaliotis californiensis]